MFETAYGVWYRDATEMGYSQTGLKTTRVTWMDEVKESHRTPFLISSLMIFWLWLMRAYMTMGQPQGHVQWGPFVRRCWWIMVSVAICLGYRPFVEDVMSPQIVLCVSDTRWLWTWADRLQLLNKSFVRLSLIQKLKSAQLWSVDDLFRWNQCP